ncbi:hypothetical protein HK096_004227, partial [Nowakowskiella sp. JEL0078]
KNEPKLDHLVAGELILVRIWETEKDAGIRTSSGKLIAPVVANVRYADLVEDTEYEGEPTVTNPSYDLNGYGLTRNSVNGTVDIVVMVPVRLPDGLAYREPNPLLKTSGADGHINHIQTYCVPRYELEQHFLIGRTIKLIK